VAYFVFQEPLTWQRIGGLVLVTCGVGLFFAK
jgi:drug/metabolite transporter (DMT)-like permease